MSEEKKQEEIKFDWKPMVLLLIGFSLGMIGMYYMKLDKETTQQAYWMCSEYVEETAKIQGAFCYQYPCPSLGNAYIPDFSNLSMGKIPKSVNLTRDISRALE